MNFNRVAVSGCKGFTDGTEYTHAWEQSTSKCGLDVQATADKYSIIVQVCYQEDKYRNSMQVI